MKKIFSELKNYLALCVVYGVLSLLVFAASEHQIHISMVFNLCLAIIPLLLSRIFLRLEKRWAMMLIAVVWMLFLPNAFYMLTDFIHVSQLEFFTGDYYEFKTVEYVMSTTIYLEMISITLGYVLSTIAAVWSVCDAENWLKKNMESWRVPIMIVIFGLVGYAIYIGRFIRLYSWDVLNVPLLVRKLADGMGWDAVWFSLLFALYAAGIYAIYRVVSEKKAK